MIMPDVVNVPGLGVLTEDRLGEPATERWISISPAGEIREHVSTNRHAYCVELDSRLQWQLIRDVYAAIDPYGRCGDHMLGVAEVICDHERAGIFLSPCRHSGLGAGTPL